MDPVAAKYIGAGIACIGMGGAGVGVGMIFGHYLAAALRNPSAAQGQFGNLIFGFARDRSARHLLAADRAPAAVRAVRPNARAALPPALHGVADGREESDERAYRTPGGHKGAFPPFQKETFASQLVWLASPSWRSTC